MKIVYFDGSISDNEVVESVKDGKAKYQDDNEHGEYFVLEANGNLGFYDSDGKFDEALKVKQ